MSSIPWHVCVLIPAHNEEKLLPRCLYSVLAACKQLPYQTTSDIILAVDSSTDNTLNVGIKILKNRGTVLIINESNVGCARKIATEAALMHYQGPLNKCWLAHTDADCKVPKNWLVEQIKLANSGVQGVTGIVKVDSYAEHDKNVPAKFLNQYVINPNGTHPHIHGANMGVRADIYKMIGGWRELATAEDHDLWNRLSLLNIKQVSDAKLCVLTSGRKIGRAPNGFAAKLASFNGDYQ